MGSVSSLAQMWYCFLAHLGACCSRSGRDVFDPNEFHTVENISSFFQDPEIDKFVETSAAIKNVILKLVDQEDWKKLQGDTA